MQKSSLTSVVSTIPIEPHMLNSPFPQPFFFFNRKKELQRLSQFFDHNKRIILPAITGPTGSGKRSLLLQFIREYGHQYDFILWIPASSQMEIRIAYQKIANELSIPIKIQNQQSLARVVYNRLSIHNCLYIFSNAPSFTTLQPHLPKKGHVVITSPNCSSIAWPSKPFYISPLTEQEKLQFIQYYEKNNSSFLFPSFLLSRIPPYPLALTYTLHLLHNNYTVDALITTLKKNHYLFRVLSKNPTNLNYYYQFIRYFITINPSIKKIPFLKNLVSPSLCKKVGRNQRKKIK